MKHIIIALLSAGFVFLQADAQDTAVLKRKPYHLVLRYDKQTDYEEDLKETPYLNPGNTLQLYPGETVYLEVTLQNGKIASMKAVPENRNPDKTILVSFEQTIANGVHENVTLKVKNPFPKPLIYEARIFMFKIKKWVPTDVYPVDPGLFGIEIWPDFITSIGLNGWTLGNK